MDHPVKPVLPVAPEADPGTPRRIASRDLFDGAREILIDHDGRLYRMRITQNGKLILTA
jgi:hemin uptake protein HemP